QPGGRGQVGGDDHVRAAGGVAHEAPHSGDVRGPYDWRAAGRRGDPGSRHAIRYTAGRAAMPSAASAVAVAIAQRRSLLHSDAIQRVLAFGALIVLFAIFSVASPNFLQFDNIVGILLATSVNGVLALGVTFVIITGGIDLSVGTVMTLSAVM